MLSIADSSPERQAIPAPQAPPALVALQPGSAGEADSVRLPCLNSNISIQPLPEELPELSPYHQKSAFTLGENVQRFCSLYGIENCAFFTITFPDNVTDHKEASRRFNSLNSNFLGTFYGEWIWDRERQKRGAWHYHMIIQCKGDIRTGFDWDEYLAWLTDYSKGKRRRLRTGNAFLRSLWSLNKRALPAHGFGTIMELLPIRSTAEAVGKYVGKYISKQIGQRPDEDKGVRLTSHSKGFTASVPRFSWNTDGAKQWRKNLALFAIHACCCSTHDEFLERAPRRWAYRFRKDIMSYHRHYAERYPEEAPF